MKKIQLLYIKNVISRKKRLVQQELTFFILLENLGFNKQVDIVWAGEEGIWQTLVADFHSHHANNGEYWQAHAKFNLTNEHSLPGNIVFGLRYRVSNGEYWDNNKGMNYASQADSGLLCHTARPVLNVDWQTSLTEHAKFFPVTVAVNSAVAAEKVTIHWTTDNWQTTHKTRCHLQRKYWDKTALSNARNPNQYGVQIWKGWLKINHAFRLNYGIACENKQGQTLWDNHQGNNYQASHEPFKVMILNLHCYQEDNQDYKLSQIAKAIDELDADIVCLQEVAEHWNNGQGDWNSNAAKIINDRLPSPYHLYTDWSHLGFDKYREGVAILSRYPILKRESMYVSEDADPFSIHSRKVVMSQLHIPYIGLINVFSAHLSWWEDGFQTQFKHLHEWAEAHQTGHIKATLLCGDFNITAGSQGYYQVIDQHGYNDQYLTATRAVSEQNYRINDPYWQQQLAADYRIDYIFINKEGLLQAVSAKTLFTDQDYGRVSDHNGYLMVFEPK